MKAWFLIVVLAGSAIAAGQPATAVPRAPGGKPSLQGIWRVQNTADWDIQDHSPALGIPPGAGIVVGNEIPYQPWAAEKKKENFQNRATADPNSKCFLPGVPRVMYLPFPLQILQTPKYVVIASEYVHADRIIPLDGSAHPEDIDFWMGDSRGHWEGDTLVVDVRNFNDQTWFDRAGNFHSAALHIVERYNRTGPDTLRYEATVEDPKVFTGPWKISTTLYRDTDKNAQILEYDCFAYREPAGGAK